ncbi:MAG: hypothetical protein LBS31_00620 [Candidatus Adiutrix sp.]|nr:hypothetical protein [Candidatus Adiutrix sp.]
MLKAVAAISLLLLMKAPAAAWAEGPEDFAWWRPAGQERTRDGGLEYVYELVLPAGLPPEPGVEIYGRVKTWRRSGASRETVSPEWFSLKAEPSAESSAAGPGAGSAGGPVERVVIYSGRTEQFELWAEVRAGGLVYTAHTLFNGYGDSGRSRLTPIESNGPEPAGREPAMRAPAGLALAMSQTYYRAQTGEPVVIESRGLPGPPGPVTVFEEGRRRAAELAPGEAGDGRYAYTPPHDPALAEAGYSVSKNLVFAASDQGGGRVWTLSLPVYRSFYGHVSLKLGLMIMAAAGLLSCALVGLAGRNFMSLKRPRIGAGREKFSCR